MRVTMISSVTHICETESHTMSNKGGAFRSISAYYTHVNNPHTYYNP